MKIVSVERKSHIFKVVQSVPKGYAEQLEKSVQEVTALALMAKKMIRNGGTN